MSWSTIGHILIENPFVVDVKPNQEIYISVRLPDYYVGALCTGIRIFKKMKSWSNYFLCIKYSLYWCYHCPKRFRSICPVGLNLSKPLSKRKLEHFLLDMTIVRMVKLKYVCLVKECRPIHALIQAFLDLSSENWCTFNVGRLSFQGPNFSAFCGGRLEMS